MLQSSMRRQNDGQSIKGLMDDETNETEVSRVENNDFEVARVRHDVNEVLDSFEVDVSNDAELETVYEYLQQQLQTVDHMRLILVCEFVLFVSYFLLKLSYFMS